MLLSRWQQFNPVWNQLHQLQQEMNRILERTSEKGGKQSIFASVYPLVNMWEADDAVFVEAELPGLSLNDLEIFVAGGNQLSIKGERKGYEVEKGVWHRRERSHGSFVRVLTLPFDVNSDTVDARFENGVLLIKLAKHEAAKPRKIQVKGE